MTTTDPAITGTLERWLPDADATIALGTALAPLLRPGLVIYLEGDLGAGKTTLARALVQALAPGTRVKSPTYTLHEHYETPGLVLNHFDLYRIADAQELDYVGVRDLAQDAVLLIEWPERGAGALPPPDLVIALAHRAGARTVRLTACGDVAGAIIASLIGPASPGT